MNSHSPEQYFQCHLNLQVRPSVLEEQRKYNKEALLAALATEPLQEYLKETLIVVYKQMISLKFSTDMLDQARLDHAYLTGKRELLEELIALATVQKI